MVKLISAGPKKHYSTYGSLQSVKNELRGAGMHIAGAFSLLLAHVISIAPKTTGLDKESLTLTFFGTALYLLVHSQDLLAIRAAAQNTSRRKSKKGSTVTLSANLSRDVVVAWLYFAGSLNVALAVAFSNPRWTSGSFLTGKIQCLAASVAYTFAASLNLVSESTATSTDRRSPASTSLASCAIKILFLSASNFQLTSSVLNIQPFTEACSWAKQASGGIYCIAIALHFVGGLLNRHLLRTSYQPRRRNKVVEEFHEAASESDSSEENRGRVRRGRAYKGGSPVRWFATGREPRNESFNSDRNSDAGSETSEGDEEEYESSDEEMALRKREKRRETRRRW